MFVDETSEEKRRLHTAHETDGIVSYTTPGRDDTDKDALHNNLVGGGGDKLREPWFCAMTRRENWIQRRPFFLFAMSTTICCVLILATITFHNNLFTADNQHEASAMIAAAATTTTGAIAVQTRLGPVHGACAAAGVARGTDAATCWWRNIPFSEPMLARFGRSSLRHSSYGDDGVGSGTQNGPACFQFLDAATVAGLDVGPEESEDCLNLNIFAPASARINSINNNNNRADDKSSSSSEKQTTPSLLPVMVFVHGGGFLVGSAGQSVGGISSPGKNDRDNNNNNNTGLTYDGSRLASNGVVVVVIQYRLGVFGFLQQRDGTGGANGIGDQITALEWINRHIAAFGGDPASVTVFGESSGSVSVSLLSHLPRARGLFHRVIPESGVCYPSGDVLMNAAEAKQVRKDFLDKTGIDEEDLLAMDASELRDRTVRAYDPESEFFPLFVSGVGQPSVDGDVYPDAATRLAPLPVDLLHGFNSGEVKFLPPRGIGSFSLFSKYGKAIDSIVDRYGPHPNEADVVADACLRCQSIRYAQRVAKNRNNNNSRVYFYVYDNPRNNSVHGAELPAVFGTAGGGISMEGITLKTSEALVRRTQRIWTDFAKGLLGDTTFENWPRVLAGGGTFVPAMLIGEEETSLIQIPTAMCNKWEAIEDTMGGFATARMCAAVFVA